MPKYDALGDFLRAKSGTSVRLSFADIERILGFKLPRSAYVHRAWWSNNQTNNVMTRVWRNAGFRSEEVDMTSFRLVFRPEAAGQAKSTPEAPAPGMADVARPYSAADKERHPRRHPIFGALKGCIRIAPGVDLTEPADPEWGNIAWGDSEK